MAVSLGELTLSPRHHLSALWWLGLLYRRPKQVTDALAELSRGQALLAGTWLLVNALPYVFVLGIVGRLLVEPGRLLDLATTGRAEQLIQGIAGGIVGGIAVGIAVGISVGIAVGISVGIAFGIALLRAYYYPVHALFVFPVARPRWYRFHPLAWDDLCSLPFLGLHRLLVAYAEMDASATEREIDRLISEYPSQRMEALKARTILIARAAASGRQGKKPRFAGCPTVESPARRRGVLEAGP